LKYTLRINVEIVQGDQYNTGLRISETHEFDAKDFSELCAILVKFHKLGEALARHRSGAGRSITG
jgi:hypothetical protein